MNQEKDKIYYSRVVLIGHPSVGKTSLIERLIYYRFKVDKEMTLGSSYNYYTFTTDDNKKIKMDIWDTAGGINYASLLPMFVKKDSLVVLCTCYDDSDLIEEYLEKLNDKGCKFFICITKQDKLLDHTTFNDKFKDIEFFKLGHNIEKIYYTSSLTGIGVHEMFKDLSSYIEPVDEEIIEIHSTTPKRRECGCYLPFYK